MPTLTQLEYLVAVERERHFGRAAKSCYVAQPSLSMQIQKLEEELEVTVFDRTKKPIAVTDLGKEIIAQAKVILKEHRKLKDLADIGVTEMRGELHLAVIPTLAPYLIPLFVGQFSKKYPKVKLRINEHKTNDIIRMLIEGDIDAGLMVTPLKDQHLTERNLFLEPFYAYVAKDHKLSQKKSLSEGDLNDDSLWLLEEGHCFRDQVLKVCSLDRKKMALENVEFASGNLETLKNLVQKNSGYTLLPELALTGLSKKDLNDHVKPFKKPVPTREVSLVHNRGLLKEKLITALEEEIIATLPSNIRSLKTQNMHRIELM